MQKSWLSLLPPELRTKTYNYGANAMEKEISILLIDAEHWKRIECVAMHKKCLAKAEALVKRQNEFTEYFMSLLSLLPAKFYR